MKTKEVPVESLVPYDFGFRIFSPLFEPELLEVGEKFGLASEQRPIHIVNGREVIDGRKRLVIARLIGLKTVHTLSLDTEEVITHEQIVDRFFYHHIGQRPEDDLAWAAYYRHVNSRPSLPVAGLRGERRDAIAKMIGCPFPGPKLSKLARILDLPDEIQELYLRGELKMNHCLQIWAYPEIIWQAAFNAILSCGDPQCLVRAWRSEGKVPKSLASPYIDESLQRIQQDVAVLRIMEQYDSLENMSESGVIASLGAAVAGLDTLRESELNPNHPARWLNWST